MEPNRFFLAAAREPDARPCRGRPCRGVKAIAANGVIGDPSKASAEHGERYWEVVVMQALGKIAEATDLSS
jgi:creatinine amidohydrolase/Fe(II)-dependent formamide hydrolase-like protein